MILDTRPFLVCAMDTPKCHCFKDMQLPIFWNIHDRNSLSVLCGFMFSVFFRPYPGPITLQAL